jgi:predicted secreted protein
MSIHKGSEGTVHVGTDAVAEIRSYSIEESADTLETTSMGDSARTHLASLTSFSGSVDVYWDEADTAQTALTVGTSVTIKFYPEGTASSAKYYSGEAIVTGVSRSASFDGLVESSISIQGTGVLTLATA